MLNLLKSLFLTTDRAGPNIEMVGKSIDAVVNTAEERQNLMLAWVAATGATNVSRRLVAFIVIGIWALYQVTIWILALVSLLVPSVIELITLLKTHMEASISGAVALVIAFYFAPHAVAALKGTAALQLLLPSRADNK